MRRTICTAALIAAGMAARSYAAAPDFLKMLLKKPEPAMLIGTEPPEEGEETGRDKALEWERLTLLDERGRFNPRGLYEANLHRRAHLPPKKGHGLSIAGESLSVSPKSLYWYNWV